MKTKSKDELVTEEAKREYEHFLKFKTVVDVSFRNRYVGIKSYKKGKFMEILSVVPDLGGGASVVRPMALFVIAVHP